MPTNEYGQKTDLKGHVLKESEIIAEDIRPIFEKYVIAVKGRNVPELVDEIVKDLTDYIMQKISENYQKNVSLGIDIGRREAQAIIDSAKEAKT